MSGVPADTEGNPLEAGRGPLPTGVEDGFDPNVLLDPKTGKVVYKSQDQKTATKMKSTGPPGMLRIYTDGSALKNGRAVASAGVGVYFGPGDSRFVFFDFNHVVLLSFAGQLAARASLLTQVSPAGMFPSPSKEVARPTSALS
ncbi:hypothetical protein BO78DRAFT_174551 [Aspergillus sclerotiicarbonarius CBS 121057]|uniref:RNase H type-1 domain-containing protein n=1 Tax=Aspergillus sclerotiicarbonarius (strain CBS 121057 / IBT 28362) TaxID=1448318 RepID=A0A319ET24_ASPSB|nr:hypothetical protein BO78DRAFT_174551 [Aspergillus sclerotiicarbonarius CBS 121057]